MKKNRDRLNMKKTLLQGGGGLLAILLLLASVPLKAEKIHSKAGTTAATFLKIGPGARAVSMGEAFGALADDASALYWNPAGISQLEQRELTAMHDESFQDIRFAYAGYVHPVNQYHTWGLSVSGLLVKSDLERRSGLGESTPETPLTLAEGTFGAHDISAGVSYAFRPQPRWALGVTAKGIRQVIDSESASSAALDMGILFKSQQRPYQLGFVIQNLGPGVKFNKQAFDLPVNFKLASAWRLHPKIDLTFDINQPIDNYLRFHGGMEYRLLHFFHIRSGYKHRLYGNELGTLSGLTVGGGFKFYNSLLDYTFNPAGDLGDTHRISLSFKFGRKRSEAPLEKAAPVEETEALVPVEVITVQSEAPDEMGEVSFRLVLKPKENPSKKGPTHDVLAEANAPSDLYRAFFSTRLTDTEDLTLSLLEAGEIDDPTTYKVISFRHNFPKTPKGVGVAFKVRREWLEKAGAEPEDLVVHRLKGKKKIPLPVRLKARNGDYISFRSTLDKLGTIAIEVKK